jgi:hypothetical protein
MSRVFRQEGDWFGEKLIHNTVYFVNPDLICNGGRTAEEFQKCGTSDRLWVQLGEKLPILNFSTSKKPVKAPKQKIRNMDVLFILF